MREGRGIVRERGERVGERRREWERGGEREKEKDRVM